MYGGPLCTRSDPADKDTRSNRRSAAANRIRGPQSALTDFLASHNISAQQISSDYQRRLREAQEADAQQNGESEHNEDKENESASGDEDPVERRKRKRKEEKAIMKIKQSKEFKRRKAEKKRDDSDSDDDDIIARNMMAKAQPLPGQLENCELCEKRFTVTPYSKSGPDGGLLCTKCSKELKDEEKKAQATEKKLKQRAPAKGRKRQTESERMMGDVKPGAKSLIDICVRRVADVVQDVDEFGDMPQNLLDRLSQILSKKRVLTTRTLDLFLRPDGDRIDIYDCGKLDEEDFERLFTFMPNLLTVNLRFAGQMKDHALRYMIDKNKKIKNLQLGATNLISDAAWVELFQQQGPRLESLKLSELNDSLNDETVAVLAACCRDLQRLKLRSCSHTTESAVESIAELQSLKHLSLAIAPDSSAEILVHLISKVGHNLQTLSLEGFGDFDDAALEAVHAHCSKLNKLRLTGSNLCTDRAFAELFNSWSNPPITFLDLSDNRDIDSVNPDGPQDEPIGFGAGALKALMSHSGSVIKHLNLHSCRHITHEALIDVFDGKKQYPFLRDIDFSFVASIDDVVMNGIFRSCPALTKLAVFACFNAKEVRIPTGIAVIGLPNAQNNVVIEGDVIGEL